MFLKNTYAKQGILTLVCLLSIIFSYLVEKHLDNEPLFLLLLSAAYTSGSVYALRNAWESIKRGRLDVDFLMIVAAVGAALVNYWHEGATLLFLFSLSNTLQEYAFNRSRHAIDALLKERPNEANVLRDGIEVLTPIEKIQIGDMVVIRPGEQVAVDGIIRKGASDLNEASVTGESKPIDKGIGHQVFAGSINGVGTLEVEVSHTAEDSTLSRIIHMVESAQSTKARSQRFLDEVERYYVYTVLVGVVGFILVPWGVFGQDFSPTFYRAMVLLVVASPCALIIASPAVMLSAIACAARNGILFKGGVHLENLAEVTQAAFDKTGTLTLGKLFVTDVVLADTLPTGFQEDELLAIAASLESRSEHPIAKAILEHADARKVQRSPMEKFTILPGRGAHALVDEYLVWIGGQRLYEEHGEEIPTFLADAQERLEKEGKTVLLLHREISRKGGIGQHEEEGGWLGLIAVADKERPEVADAIRLLHQQGIKRVVMLTGDNPFVAEAVAKATGVDEVYARLMPEEKVSILNRLQRDHGPLMMVGDGVNDAPALAHAAVGVAMGAAGTDAAVESADIVLMGEDLKKLAFAVALSKRAEKMIRFNVAFSLAVISLLVAAVFLFQLPMPLGVLGHEGSTVVVVGNGLRLLFMRESQA